MANLPVVLVLQYPGTDAPTSLFEISDILEEEPWKKDSVALHKLSEGMADGVAGPANPVHTRERV